MMGVTGVYAVIVICCIPQIRLATALVKTASRFIMKTPQIFLVPVAASIFSVIWFVYWLVTYIYIYSVGTLEQNAATPFASIKWEPTTRYVIFYDVFGLFWVNAFIIGGTQFIIAFACTNWYFTSASDTFGSGSVLKGFLYLFRYHLGSIAFGSFIIAVA